MSSMLGIGSGLELGSMLDSLVKVASEPKIKQLGQKEAETQEAISGLGSLKSLLSDFQSASDALKSPGLYGQRTAAVTQPTDGDVVTVSADSTAVTGNYDITVESLAQGTRGYTAQLNVDHDADLGKTGTLTFGVADGSESFSIDDVTGMSLNQIRDAINDSDDNFGLTANVVDGRLVYNSSVTGDAANKELTVTGDADFAIDTYTQNASAAEITVDGISITNDSNTFDGIVSGLTITATKADPGAVATADVGLDTGSVKKKINAFADAYNKLREGMNELKGSYDEESGKFSYGKLTGDPIIRNIEGVLGGILTQQVEGAEAGVDSLYAVGLDIQSDGTLSVDSGRLSDTLNNSFDSMKTLFTGEEGIATQASDRIDSFLGFTGVIKGKEDSYQNIMDDLEDQYDQHARYIEGYRETLLKQFTALDSTVGRLQATMQQIGPQLAGLANIQAPSS